MLDDVLPVVHHEVGVADDFAEPAGPDDPSIRVVRRALPEPGDALRHGNARRPLGRLRPEDRILRLGLQSRQQGRDGQPRRHSPHGLREPCS